MQNYISQNSWEQVGDKPAWVYRDYRGFYIMITKPSKYIVTCSGARTHCYPDVYDGREFYDTLEQAQQDAFAFCNACLT